MKIAHLADLHLGFRQYHRQTPSGINQREADVANAFRAAVSAVLAEEPDVIIIAGDLFHAVRPTNSSIVFAFRQLQRLREALPEAPIIVVAGNHDTPRSSETGSILRLYEELGISLAADDARRFSFPKLDLSVLAVPYLSTQAPEKLVVVPDGPERHQVLVMHGDVAGIIRGDRPYAVDSASQIDPDVLKREKWSYVALGHYHVQHEIAPHIWYAGALDYVSPNPWGELDDEAKHGARGKAWLLAELSPGLVVTRMPVAAPRAVHDLKWLNADELTAPEVDRRIQTALAGVPGGITDAVVRLVVTDIPRHVARELDHAAIRTAKAAALHLQLDLRKPESRQGIGLGASGRRQTLPELVGEFLGRRPLPERVPRDRFVSLGLDMLAESDDAAPGGDS